MLYFSLATALSILEIKDICNDYIECEAHSPWDIFKEYTSARTGLHLYDKGNSIIGYWESGERNRSHSLLRAKNWMVLRMKEQNNQTTISGCVFFCPTLFFALLVGFLTILFCTDFLAVLLFMLISTVLLWSSMKEQSIIFNYIKNIFSR